MIIEITLKIVIYFKCYSKKCVFFQDINLTLQRFVSEYAERTIVMRERMELERARLQFDIEVMHRKQKSLETEDCKSDS